MTKDIMDIELKTYEGGLIDNMCEEARLILKMLNGVDELLGELINDLKKLEDAYKSLAGHL